MTNTPSYDLVILGGGAAAFAAITDADRRGLSTAIVNTGLPLGGTCVNVGCIPSKHLLEVGKAAHEPPQNPFDAVEYDDDQPATDWAAAIDETDEIVASLREQNYLDVAEHFGTDIYEGYGRLVDSVEQSSTSSGGSAIPRATGEAGDSRAQPGDSEGRSPSSSRTQSDDATIEVVSGEKAGTTITGAKALVATGSSPDIAPIDGIESVAYETSESILDRRDRPESIVIIGGGYVAMEWGQILHHMGTDVTILQRSNRVLSEMEGQLGRELQRCFEAEGITVETDVDVRRVSEGGETGDGITVEATVAGDSRTFSAGDLFVATGVSPNTDDIGLDEVGIETDGSGAVVVDKELRTTNSDVYAAGDCIGEPMLEAVAAKEGNHAARNAFGSAEQSSAGRSSGLRGSETDSTETAEPSPGPREDDGGASIDYHAVPKVVFTSPEVAAVGTTEPEYVDEHGTCTCRTVAMDDVPKAKTVEDTRGLVQVVTHHETDEIVGVHMVGPRAADVIPEATLAVKYGLTVDDIIDTIHPFPTFSEAFKHACQAFRRDTSTVSCCVE